MIKDKGRAGWFGASDTATIMGGWDSHTFYRWWLVKLGATSNEFTTVQMAAGTHFEHKILDALNISQRDRQIKIRKLRLRVNLDGETDSTVCEVKTYGSDVFRLSKAYWQQVQVEMFAAKKWGEIVAYKMIQDDYDNFFNEIDYKRLERIPIPYDPRWVEEDYLPRLRYLAKCLKTQKTPNLKEIVK